MWKSVSLVLGVFCIGLYVNGAIAATNAANEFWSYLKGNEDLVARVTRVDGFDGPVNAIFKYDATSLSGTSLDLVLPTPTKHQRWWGLVQDDLIDTSVPIGKSNADDSSGILRARWWIFVMTNFGVGMNLLTLVIKTCTGSAADVTVQTFGIALQTFFAGILMTSLYGIYWDPNLNIAYINYVPGWAYFWTYLVVFLNFCLVGCGLSTMLALNSCKACVPIFGLASMFLTLILVIITFYILFTISFPIFGYTLFFCWTFVDKVHSQIVEMKAPFNLEPSLALQEPFDLIAYGGGAAMFLATVMFISVWGDLKQQALDQARANAAGSSMV